MITEDQKVLDLALKALANGELDMKDRGKFAADHKRFKNQELTFRELMESIKKPTGALKDAMKSHYGRSSYTRSFK